MLNLEKKKEKNKTCLEIEAKVLLKDFGFSDQDTTEGVITFKINSCTIKREFFG